MKVPTSHHTASNEFKAYLRTYFLFPNTTFELFDILNK